MPAPELLPCPSLSRVKGGRVMLMRKGCQVLYPFCAPDEPSSLRLQEGETFPPLLLLGHAGFSSLLFLCPPPTRTAADNIRKGAGPGTALERRDRGVHHCPLCALSAPSQEKIWYPGLLQSLVQIFLSCFFPGTTQRLY